MDNQYNITLYNSQFFTELISYKFAVLPNVGDLIEVVNEQVMFIVQTRSFKPRYERGLISVTLFGVFENGEDMGQHKFEQIRESIVDQQQGIRRNREGMVEHQEFVGLPDTLD